MPPILKPKVLQEVSYEKLLAISHADTEHFVTTWPSAGSDIQNGDFVKIRGSKRKEKGVPTGSQVEMYRQNAVHLLKQETQVRI
jgi:hypothetical protein